MGEAKRRKERAELAPGVIPVRERRLLSDEWRDFYEKVYKPEGIAPGSVQYRECYRAFMGGAVSLMALLNTDTDAGGEPTQLDMDYADAIQAEIDQYAIDLAEGRA